jgi:predicted lipid-binding transport protein (Tim44 family)
MLSCGIIRYDRRRFIIATAIAGVIWACYAFFIGRLGGKAFEDKPWAGLLLAFGGTLAISALIELVRRLIRARRAPRRAGAQGQGDAEGQSDVQNQGDAERQGDADVQDPANMQGQGDAQGQGDDRECGTPSSDDAPRTPVR